MTRKYLIGLLVAVLLVVGYKYGYKNKTESPDDLLPVKVLSYRTATGWGYEIEVDGKVFIHQDNIPAIQGTRSFESSEDAIKVGEFLVEKMKNNKKPVVSVEELKNMNIKNM